MVPSQLIMMAHLPNRHSRWSDKSLRAKGDTTFPLCYLKPPFLNSCLLQKHLLLLPSPLLKRKHHLPLLNLLREQQPLTPKARSVAVLDFDFQLQCLKVQPKTSHTIASRVIVPFLSGIYCSRSEISPFFGGRLEKY